MANRKAAKRSTTLPDGAPDPSTVSRTTGLPDIPAYDGAPIIVKNPEDSAVPRPKVLAAGVAGAITTLVVWGLTEVGIDVPAEVAAAFTTLIAFVAGYFTSDK